MKISVRVLVTVYLLVLVGLTGALAMLWFVIDCM